MAVYTNTNHTSPLTGVEFTPVSDGNFTFFYVDSPTKKEAVKKWLASPEMGQEIIAESQVSGHPVLVTHGQKTKDEIIAALTAHGDKFEFHHKSKGFDAWAARGMLGITGQGMQLTSSLMQGKVNWGLFVFAVSNITANIMGMTLGAQRSEDTHRLNFLKEQFNDKLVSHVATGEALPDTKEKRSALHKEPEEPKSTSEKLGGFLRRNSVFVGELGLRYFAAFALAFPLNKWGKSFGKLKAGEFKQAYFTGRNESKLTHMAGLGSLLGKNIAFLSKSEDPYDPKPKGWLDTVREKYTFRLGGAIEALAFGTLSYTGYTKNEIQFRGKKYPDYLSGTGASLFTLAYIMRHWAKFGVKETNMDELYAHVSDSLAQVPPEKLPQLMAESAASIKEHFSDKPMDYGKVFTQIMTDLYRYHHIALDNLGTEPAERMALAAQDIKQPQKPVAAASANGSESVSEKTPMAANKTLRKPKQAPSASHAERQLARALQPEASHTLS